MLCAQCETIEGKFDAATARKKLADLQRGGPDRTTRMLLDALREQGVAGATLLDIGAGVGAVHQELLASGAASGVHVDASAAYLAVAREQATREGHATKVRFVHGDFVEVAPSLVAADVVTLDRVICCYPDVEALVGRSAEKTRRLYGAVYPRAAWWVRLGFALGNAVLRLRRSAFRIYLHAPSRIDGLLTGAGFARCHLERTLIWEVAVYRRRGRGQAAAETAPPPARDSLT